MNKLGKQLRARKNSAAASVPRSSARKRVRRRVGRGGVEAVAAAYTRPMRTGIPSVSGSPFAGDGKIVVRHREYIQDIAGSVAFSVSSFSVNPGLQQMFTWLSSVAAQYESYLIRNLQFEFETQKSSATAGSVMMSMDFDAGDSAPGNKQQLMSYSNAVRSAVWAECCYTAAQADLQKFGIQRYVRQGAVPSGQDVKTFDVGTLFVATQGCADTSVLGELYVSYDIELRTPQNDIVAQAQANSIRIVTTGASRAAPFTGTQSSAGSLLITATGATITFNQVGQYLVDVDLGGTTFTDTSPTITGTVSNAELLGGLLHNTAVTAAIDSYRVNVLNRGETMIFDFTASAATITSSQIRVAQYAFANA